MEFLRDPAWQSFGAVIAALALIFYVYVERIKVAKLYMELITLLSRTLGGLSNLPLAIVHWASTILNALFLLSLIYFILYAPIFLYQELKQPNHVGSTNIDQASIFYGLVVIVWCLSIMTIKHKLTIDKLNNQIDYLNRIPGIKKLKGSYNKQLFDVVLTQWNDFRDDLVAKHDDSPFAIDLATCFPLDVDDEILKIGCPNNVTHKRMNRKAPSSSIGYDEEYEAWKRDKDLIERLVKGRFKVIQISYTFDKQIRK